MSRVAARLVHRVAPIFHYPSEVEEYLHNLLTLDDPQNAPHQWDSNIGINLCVCDDRKLKMSLKSRVMALNLADSQEKLNNYITELNSLRFVKQQMITETDRLCGQYVSIVKCKFELFESKCVSINFRLSCRLPNIKGEPFIF